jgi:hypothetical protein
MSKPLIPIVAAAVILSLAACSDSSGQATIPSPLPTASVTRAACDARGRVLDIVGQVQTGAVQSKSDLSARLREAARTLDAEARRLRSKGLQAAASKVSSLSAATVQLADAVDRADSAAIVAAAAKAAGAIQGLPGCPSPSASPST